MSERTPEWIPLIFHVRETYRPFELKVGDSMAAEIALLAEYFSMDPEAMALQAIRHFLLDESVARVVQNCPGSGRLKLHPDWRRQARKVLSERAGGGVRPETPGQTSAQESLSSNANSSVSGVSPKESPAQLVRRLTLTLESSEEGLRIIQTF